MAGLETLAQATSRLERDGYTDLFLADGHHLRARDANRLYEPEEMIVDEIVRFEGPTNPADECAVFALRTPDGVKGTYVVTYGPAIDPADAEIVRRLETR